MSWKDFAFTVRCNDGPEKIIRVVAKNKLKATEYVKKMYPQNYVYADDRYNVWDIEEN